MDKLKHNLWQLAIALDQLFNVIFGLIIFDKSSADETLSSRAYRSHCGGYWYGTLAMKIIDTIFFFDRLEDKKHCELSYYSEIECNVFDEYIKADIKNILSESMNCNYDCRYNNSKKLDRMLDRQTKQILNYLEGK